METPTTNPVVLQQNTPAKDNATIKKVLFASFFFILLVTGVIVTYFIVKNAGDTESPLLQPVEAKKKDYPGVNEYSTTNFIVQVTDPTIEAKTIQQDLQSQTNFNDITVKELTEGIFQVKTSHITDLGEIPNSEDETKDIINKMNFDKLQNVLSRQVEPIGYIDSAQPELLFQAYTIEDPLYTDQWAHTNSRAEEGWLITEGDSSVTIAIIDTGVTISHEDLTGNIWTNDDEIEDNGLDDDQNGYIDDIHGYDFMNDPEACIEDPDCIDMDPDPSDYFGHGTHCAGIAAGDANKLGIRGVCPNCSIMPIRVGGDKYFPESSIIQGIQYAIANNADIINMSFGGYGNSPAIQAKLEEANNAGIALVAAAGNDSTYRRSYPAAYDFVIGVAALDENTSPTSYSNGNYDSIWIDIAAPGGDIHPTEPENLSTWIISTLPDKGIFSDASGYGYLQGTSMASPYVAGLAGLLKSTNPDWTNDHIRRALRVGSTFDIAKDKAEQTFMELGRLDRYVGIGSLNVPNSLNVSLSDTDINSQINILSPDFAATVNRVVDLRGTVVLPEGTTGKMYIGKGLYPKDMSLLAEIDSTNDLITTFDSRDFEDGTHTIYVTIARNSDQQIIDKYIHHLHIQNFHIEKPQPADIFGPEKTIEIAGSFPADSYIVQWSVHTEDNWTDDGIVLRNEDNLLAEWNIPETVTQLENHLYDIKIAGTFNGKEYGHRTEKIVIDSRLHGTYPQVLDSVQYSDFIYEYPGILEPIIANLDEDNENEIVVQQRRFELDEYNYGTDKPVIHIFDDTGARKLSFDFYTPSIAGGYYDMPRLTVGDLGIDGTSEIIFVQEKGDPENRQSFLTAIDASGTTIFESPVYTGSNNYASGVVDLNNDGSKEVIYSNIDSSRKYVAIFSSNGELLQQWDVDDQTPSSYVPNSSTMYPLALNLDEDSDLEIIIPVPWLTKLFAYNNDGTIVSGFPINTNFQIVAPLTAVDLNGDRQLDLLMGCYDAKRNMFLIQGLTVTGEEIFSTEFDTNYQLISTPIVSDLNQDRVPEILAQFARRDQDGNLDMLLYVLNNDGSIRDGWPQTALQSWYEPVVGDIDDDKDLEVLAVNNDNGVQSVVAYDPDGTRSEITPLYHPQAFVNISVLDIDNDEKSEIISTSVRGNSSLKYAFQPTLYVWDTNGKQRSTYTSIWPMYLKSPTRNAVDTLSYAGSAKTTTCKSIVGKVKVDMVDGWRCSVIDEENQINYLISITHDSLPREITLSNLGRGPFCESGCDQTLFFETERVTSYITQDGDRGEVSFGFKDTTLYQEHGGVWAAITFESETELNAITALRNDLITIFESVEYSDSD